LVVNSMRMVRGILSHRRVVSVSKGYSTLRR